MKSKKAFNAPLEDLASRDLVTMWRSGSEEAARVLSHRYEVRLIALVAARLNRRYRETISAEDVVQSAMGSFFRAMRANSKSLRDEHTASAWNLLATFARRKLSRALEREAAVKRGGGRARTSLDENEPVHPTTPSATHVADIFADLNSLLSDEQLRLLELLLANTTQREIAERLEVDERTVRRRIEVLRTIVADGFMDVPSRGPIIELHDGNLALPNIQYRQFVLGKMVGSGALGKVFRARLQTDGRVVAVKFMHRHLWTDTESRLSFLREIDHASRIDHPGVVKYLGWGQSPHGGPYLVSEYIDGSSLAHARPGDADTAVKWLRQICNAVEAAHQAGVLHADLTPNNVLVSSDGRVLITDFGFATLSHQTNDESNTPLTSVFANGGTLGFAAPEQVSLAFGRLSTATDIYAIGGLAYFLLTGHGPHERGADSLTDTLADDDVAQYDAVHTRAESKLADVARVALKKAVQQRPKSVTALAVLLSD